jgi:hypothetical protein
LDDTRGTKNWTPKTAEETMTEPSLADFFSSNSPSQVSFSSSEEEEANASSSPTSNEVSSASSNSVSANVTEIDKGQSMTGRSELRTVLDFAAAKKKDIMHFTNDADEKSEVYPDCPLDFFSRVCCCHDDSSPSNDQTVTKSDYRNQTFDTVAKDDNENTKLVYPMNCIDGNQGSVIMLTYHDIPYEVSSTEIQLSGTELLLHAAVSEDYMENKRRRMMAERSKKRKAVNSTISLDDLGDCLLMKKRKLEDENADIWKQLLLSMTIGRDWTRPNAGLNKPKRGHVLSKAFLWSTVPTLELVLIDNMK